MGLKSIELKNKGMSQDTSISLTPQEFAFRNYNIRIQATDDNTLLSITNIKGPTMVSEKAPNYGKPGTLAGIFITKTEQYGY